MPRSRSQRCATGARLKSPRRRCAAMDGQVRAPHNASPRVSTRPAARVRIMAGRHNPRRGACIGFQGHVTAGRRNISCWDCSPTRIRRRAQAVHNRSITLHSVSVPPRAPQPETLQAARRVGINAVPADGVEQAPAGSPATDRAQPPVVLVMGSSTGRRSCRRAGAHLESFRPD